MNCKTEVYTTLFLFIFLLSTSISLIGQELMNAKEPNDNRVLQEKILFSAKPLSGNYYSIYMMNPDGTEPTQLFNDSYHRRCPIISQNHTHLFYLKRKLIDENYTDSAWICKSLPDGSEEEIVWTYTSLDVYGGLRNNFDISPDNKKLIYANYEDFSPFPGGRNGDVFEYDFTSGQTTNLTNDWDFLEDDPSFSPNGALILYTKNGTVWSAAPWNMFIMNSDGTSNTLTLPNGSGHYGRPEFSPDGNQLLFTYNTSWEPNRLYISNIDGSNTQQVIISDGTSDGITEPTFNPDGTMLAFARTNSKELVITNSSGNVLQIVDADLFDGYFEIEWGFVNLDPRPAPAGPISGPFFACESSTGVVYSISPVTNATGYVWTLPAGVNIISGGNTNTISVEFGPDAESGYISVYGTNDAGSGEPSPLYYVKVHPYPADIGEQTNDMEVSINNGLIAYYPFDGNADDFSGNGNHGINHSATAAEDRCGNTNSSMHFNGEDNWIEVPNSPSLQSPEQALSVSSWIKAESAAIYFICKVNGPSYNAYQFRTGINLLSKQFFLGLNGVDHCWEDTILVDLALNEWFLFTITYDRNNIKFYFNGELSNIHPLTDPIIPNSERLEIGRDAHGPIEWMMGCLDDLRIYNRSLSAEEIALLYRQSCYPVYLEGSLAPNSVCRGENASLEIINAQAGVSYQLLKDGIPYGTARIGNLDTLNFSLNNLQETGSFTVEATDTASGCSIVLDTTFTVSVLSPNVTATAIPDDEYAPAAVSLGSASSGASSFEWFLDGNLIATTEQAEVELGEPGNYSFVLVATSGPPANCTVMDTVAVELKESIDVVMDIPNAFTPNGDGINDYFEIYTEGINRSDVWVKDKWGLLIKEFDGQNDKWDGNTTSGREAPDGPYFFHVKATDYRDRPMEESGIVYLFRDLIDLTPNPASQKIMIRMNGRLPGERTACISSIDGISLFEDKFSGEMLEADVSMLKPGLYFIRICNGKDQQYLKFIKE